MGIYRPLDLSVNNEVTALVNAIDRDIRELEQNRIGSIYKSDLAYDIVQFKKHLDCSITKCNVGLAIIEGATLAFCKDLLLTGDIKFKDYSIKLLELIMCELSVHGTDYNGILMESYRTIVGVDKKM